VATFLAVLEMCKDRVLKLAGGDRDCTVCAVENEETTDSM